jgi:basic membrane protein A
MSSKRWLAITAVLLVSIALVGAAPSMKKEVTEIHLWFDQGQTIKLSTSDKIELVWRWGNCSYGLSQDWIAHTDILVTLYEGEDVLREIPTSAGRWDEPFESGSHPQCLHGDTTIWRTYWRYPLNLPPGDYRFEAQASISAPLTDGLDYEPDGFLNVTPGGMTWEPAPVTLAVTPGRSAEKICVVNEPGGSESVFNRSVAEGLDRASSELNVKTATLDAETPDELRGNIQRFVDHGNCDLIIGVGFLVWAPMDELAGLYPDQRFVILDPGFAGPHDNVAAMMFRVDQASFLAGYVAAGISETDAVGVFGGIPIEPVTMFMDGYALGVEWFNAENGASVVVHGWDPETQAGLFSGDFTDRPLGQALASGLYDDGADTVFPVAGLTGFGALDEAGERKAAGELVRVIGVDFDWSDEFGDPDEVILTSVVKDLGVATYNQIEALVDGSWEAGTFWQGLETGAVYLAPFHELDDQVPEAIKDALEGIRQGIIDGTIPTRPEIP